MADITEVQRAVPFEQNEVDLAGVTVTSIGGMSHYAINWMTSAANMVPPYWSPMRDTWMRDFVTTCDPLKIAINTFVNKATSIPFSVTARDSSMKNHIEQAASVETNLLTMSGLLAGWKTEFKKFIQDYLTNDNGAFLYVQGRGRTSGPVLGPAMGVMHLDSARCQRTGDPEFPVIYLHTTGERYAIHYTRIIQMANLPSPRAEMYGVGLCAVSCAIEPSLELRDIATYSSEKFGSRPPRQILYAKTGATLDQLTSAVRLFDERVTSSGLTRFSRTMMLAPKVANQTLELDTLDMASVPDGFDREKVTILDLAMIASAFGLDLRDLAISFGVAGQTRADAEVQDKKGRGKGVHELLETLSDKLNALYLPPHLKINFDTLDDDQDEQRANIRETRSSARERDLRSGITTVRYEREKMLENGEMTEEQFNEMELIDGRTPDGLDVLMLFHSNDGQITKWLGGFSVADPTDIASNDPVTMAQEIQERKRVVFIGIEEAHNAKAAWKARQAMAALDKLHSMYQNPAGLDISDQVMVEAMDEGADAGAIENSVEPVEVEEEVEVEDESNDESEGEVVKKKQFDGALNAELERAVREYRNDFKEIIRQAQAGEMARDYAEQALSDIIAAILLLLFFRGSRLSMGNIRVDEQAAITEMLEANRVSMLNFLDDVYAGRYNDITGLGLEGAFRRIGVWENMAVLAYSLGQMARRDDPYLRWVRNIFKDSCGSCLRLDGQVHRASEWRASGWLPRSNILECHGFNCGCTFVETVGPSRGNF